MHRFICLLCLIPALVTAQSSKDKGARTCRIVFAGAPADAPEKLHLFDGTSSQEVELPRMNLSPVYKLPAGPLVVALVPSPASKPEPASPEAPKAAIAEGITDLYLFVTSDPSNKIAPVKLEVVDATATNPTKGRMICVNLTANTVNGKIGTQELALGPNAKAVLGLPAATAGEYPVDLTFRMPDKDAVYPLCETKWSHAGPASNLLVVVMESGSRTPRIMAFPDHREAGTSKASRNSGKR